MGFMTSITMSTWTWTSIGPTGRDRRPAPDLVGRVRRRRDQVVRLGPLEEADECADRVYTFSTRRGAR